MIGIIECSMCKKMARANLILGNNNVCTICEQKIVGLKTDHKDYPKYKERIKQVLCYSYGM